MTGRMEYVQNGGVEFYCDGILQGTAKKHLSQCESYYVEKMVSGNVPDGVYICEKNGMKIIANYANNVRNGRYEVFESGKKTCDWKMKDGVCNGLCVTYQPNGDVFRRVYDNGVCVSTEIDVTGVSVYADKVLNIWLGKVDDVDGVFLSYFAFRESCGFYESLPVDLCPEIDENSCTYGYVGSMKELSEKLNFMIRDLGKVSLIVDKVVCAREPNYMVTVLTDDYCPCLHRDVDDFIYLGSFRV